MRRPDTGEAVKILADGVRLVRTARNNLPPEPSNPVRPDLAAGFRKLAEEAAKHPTPDEKAADLKEQARRRTLEENSGVPARYRTAGNPFDMNAVPDDAVVKYDETVKALASLIGKPGMVALLGPRGTGKTWMACGLVTTFCRHGRYALYRDAMDYFLELKASYDDGAKVNQQAIEARYLRPELLVLDEVHERGDTAWEDRMLTRLINKRYAAELSTVLISNQDEKTFAERIGASIADRIHDGGGVIVCDWESLRGRIQ